jgi:hypothetical protein
MSACYPAFRPNKACHTIQGKHDVINIRYFMLIVTYSKHITSFKFKPSLYIADIPTLLMSTRTVLRLTDYELHNAWQLLMEVAVYESTTGCMLVSPEGSTLLSRNQKGYIQIKVNRVVGDVKNSRVTPNTKVQAHQVIACIQEGRPDLAAAVKGIGEVSHRCHRKNCVNVDHIVGEPSKTNKSRNGCPVVCFVGGVEYSVCTTIPPCIPTEEVRLAARNH